MKKMLIALAAVASLFITGCDEKPDAATVKSFPPRCFRWSCREALQG